MVRWLAMTVALVLAASPAWAQTSPQPPRGGCVTGTEPACGPPPPPPDDWDAQKKCPATIDCMPGWDKERAERCAWVKKNGPDTQVVY
jgi:hypothetical protein